LVMALSTLLHHRGGLYRQLLKYKTKSQRPPAHANSETPPSNS
jgi:hypothetical protein